MRGWSLSDEGRPSPENLSFLRNEPQGVDFSAAKLADFESLKYEQNVLRAEGQINYWMETGQGWSEFESLVGGDAKAIARTQATTVVFEYLDHYPDFANDRTAIMDGFRRLIRVGCAIAVASGLIDGRERSKSDIDQTALSDLTAETMNQLSESSFTTVEQYGFESRKEQAINHYLLEPLRIPADVWGNANCAELILMGQSCLKYGISLGRSLTQ